MTEFQSELLRLTPVVRAYAMITMRHRPADADDLVQDTLERAWRARARFEPGTNMKAWLFTILRHSRHNTRRRMRRSVEDPGEVLAGGLMTEASQGWRAEFSNVLDAMDALDPSSREALVLVTAGLSYEETARVCGFPLRTVQSRVRRARQRLAACDFLETFESADRSRSRFCVGVSRHR